MPNVAQTRIETIFVDKASAGIKNLTANYANFSKTVQGTNLGAFASNADKAASSLSNMNKTMERLVYSASRYFVIYKAMGAVGNVWDTLVGGSYEYAKSLETNQIGIAGILKSMITLNGEQVKWNDAMAISGKAMKGLQSEALRTAATSKELIETFRAILGPGLSSGMSIDQIVQLSTVGTNAVRSLGLPTNQYVQELRSMITEGIRPASSTLATSLGITNKDIKAAKASSEGLFKFLMDRMTGFADAVKYTSGTVEGRIARIQEGLQVAGAKGAKALYESWSDVLERIANYLIPVPEKLGAKWEINPAFIKSIESIAKTVGKISSSLADFGGGVAPILGGLGGAGLSALDQMADKLKYVLGFFAAKSLAPFVRDLASITVNSREAYEAQTAFGRVLQGVSDKLRGRTIELQKALEVQKLYNKETSAINAIYAQQRKNDKPLAMGWSYNQATDAWKPERLDSFIARLKAIGVEEERIKVLAEQYFKYLKTGTEAGAVNIEKVVGELERLRIEQEKSIDNWQKNSQRASELMSTLGGLSMGIGLLCDVLAQADEENKEWYESAGNAAMTAGMLSMAVGSITSAVSQMIPVVLNGARALRTFAEAKGLAGLGLAGGVVAGVGAIVYNAYKNFQDTGIATAIDEYGNEVSHDFGTIGYSGVGNLDSHGNRKRGADFAVVDATAGNIGLSYDKSGGTSGGGGGGSSKANKAAEYLERMHKIVADLDKEMTNMRGNATAYEKTMATAKDKLAGYEKDIVKAQQLGVDIGEVRKKQEEYMLAVKKKAVEAQEDENLKFMKLEEEQANRINILGYGTMEQQREIYGQRLEAHKTYLEELLAQDIENKERRYQLEKELADVQKQINDNTVYDFKSGWTQALDELANRQTNFKDVFVSAFDSIEGSLVSLVSGTESAKDKFKKFCEDITKTILQSMTQIIIRGLITNAILRAIGMGSSISVGNLSGMSQLSGTFAGGSVGGYVPSGYSAGSGISVGLAGGGIAQAGGTYVVGENGPELLRMGSQSGRVYNNRQSSAMMSGVENVKVEVINKSGQEVKANNANVRFDGKTMIISTVIEAVNNNYMGMRTMLKGVATT